MSQTAVIYMKADFVNPFLVAFMDVLGTMAQVELTHGQAERKDDSLAHGDVFGVVGMVGPQIKGSFAVSFDEKLALKTFANMLGEQLSEIDDQISDMVGEITNMVCGGAKRELGERGYEFEMATPSVISGESHSIHHKVDGPRILMPFESDFGKAYLEICFND